MVVLYLNVPAGFLEKLFPYYYLLPFTCLLFSDDDECSPSGRNLLLCGREEEQTGVDPRCGCLLLLTFWEVGAPGACC